MTRHLQSLKKQLKAKGWRQQDAAQEVGVTYEHLNRVLNGRRESRSLLLKIDRLPKREAAAVA